MADLDLVDMLLAQWASLSPLLIAYLVGILLALVYRRRCPVPALLTVLAMGLLLVTTVLQTALSQYVILTRAPQGWSNVSVRWMFIALGTAGNLLRALAMGLLLAAVFVRRKTLEPAGPRRELPFAEPAPGRPGDEGITNRPGF
jgi:hypothetical protein